MPLGVKFGYGYCDDEAKNEVDRHAPGCEAGRIESKEDKHRNALINVQRKKILAEPTKCRVANGNAHRKEDYCQREDNRFSIPTEAESHRTPATQKNVSCAYEANDERPPKTRAKFLDAAFVLRVNHAGRKAKDGIVPPATLNPRERQHFKGKDNKRNYPPPIA